MDTNVYSLVQSQRLRWLDQTEWSRNTIIVFNVQLRGFKGIESFASLARTSRGSDSDWADNWLLISPLTICKDLTLPFSVKTLLKVKQKYLNN